MKTFESIKTCQYYISESSRISRIEYLTNFAEQFEIVYDEVRIRVPQTVENERLFPFCIFLSSESRLCENYDCRQILENDSKYSACASASNETEISGCFKSVSKYYPKV